jgi:hypothetical protein
MDDCLILLVEGCVPGSTFKVRIIVSYICTIHGTRTFRHTALTPVCTLHTATTLHELSGPGVPQQSAVQQH